MMALSSFTEGIRCCSSCASSRAATGSTASSSGDGLSYGFSARAAHSRVLEWQGRGALAYVSRSSTTAAPVEPSAELAESGFDQEIKKLKLSRKRGTWIPYRVFLPLLQECIRRKDVKKGREVHDLILGAGYGSNRFLASNLVRMYALCGSLRDAHAVFNGMSKDVSSYTALITGYAHNKRGREAIKFFKQMQQEGIKPDKYAYVAVLKACSNVKALEEGKAVHAIVKGTPYESDGFVCNILIDMYAKCGALEEAREVFDKLAKPNVISWTALIAGLAQQGHGEEAFSLFERMQEEGVEPNPMTLVSVLKSCVTPSDLKRGKLIHSHVDGSRYKSDVFVGTSLVDMYAKCGSLSSARQVFDELQQRDLVLWNAMISGYAHSGLGDEALNLFEKMQAEARLQPDAITFVSVLKACTDPPNLKQGSVINNLVMNSVHRSDVIVRSSLIDMFAKCGNLDDAFDVFEKIRRRDLIAWTTMITAYVQHGQSDKAFEMFDRMQQEGLKPDKVTFISILKACASPEALELGKMLHSSITKNGFDTDLAMESTIVRMYVKCGSIADAAQAFHKSDKKHVETWNALLSGYVEAGLHEETRELRVRMQQEAIEPDVFSFAAMLKGCSGPTALEQVKLLHDEIKERRMCPDLFLQNTLVNMYAKSGSLENAHRLFDEMSEKNVVSWTTMISAYADRRQDREAQALFSQMQQEGIAPNLATYLSALKACSTPASLEHGKQLHAGIVKSAYNSNAFIGNSLIDMYAKCGNIEDARQVFENMPKRDMVAWTTLITGYVQHGRHDEALSLFRRMELEDCSKDSTAFLKIIKACAT